MILPPAGLIDRLFIRYARGFPHPGKLRVLRAAYQTVRGGMANVRLPDGRILKFPASDYIGHAIISTGTYEAESVALAHKLLDDGGTFIDVGANFGLYAAQMAAKPGVKVLAIEPDPENFLLLKTNCLPEAGGNCVLLNALVAAEPGIFALEIGHEGNRGTIRVAMGGPRSILSAAVTLRQALEASGMHTIDLMKVDVEGFEKSVFEGCPFEGQLRPKNIIVEYTSMGERMCDGWSAADMLAFFTAKGYSAFTVTGKPLHGDPPESNAWFRDLQS